MACRHDYFHEKYFSPAKMALQVLIGQGGKVEFIGDHPVQQAE
jgi:hypothetical protein